MMTSSLPAASDLAEYQHYIQEMVINGHTNNDIVADLARRGVTISNSTLKRRLHFWGIRRANSIIGVKVGGVTDALIEAVNYTFHHTILNDDAIAARILTDYRLQTTGRQVRTIRSRFNWLRASSGSSQAARTAATKQLVHQVINGPGRTFGRRWIITYLREQFGFRACQVDVSTAQRLIDPDGVTSRLPGLRKIRLENYTTSGPNFLWYLDGHDKFSQYGIQIYAAVDAYSRKIIWFYVGNSNRTAISVVNQYFNAVQVTGIYPRFIRTNKGTETVLLADLHFSLYIEAALRAQWPE
jgi:hypothetical protein